MKKQLKPFRVGFPAAAVIRGFFDGLMHTASQQPDGVIQSAYLCRHRTRYGQYTAARAQLLHDTIRPLAAQASRLLADYNRTLRLAAPSGITQNNNTTVSQLRSAREAEAQYRRQKAQQTALLQEMIQVQTDWHSALTQTNLEMIETAQKLEAIFYAYSKGVLRRRAVTKSAIESVALPAFAQSALAPSPLLNALNLTIEKEVIADETV